MYGIPILGPCLNSKIFPYLDLRSELEVKVKKQTDIGDDELSNKHHSSLLTAHTSTVSVGVSTSPLVKSTPVGTPNKHPAIHQPQPITPSARLSALNMVGDLLRKVGVSYIIIIIFVVFVAFFILGSRDQISVLPYKYIQRNNDNETQ